MKFYRIQTKRRLYSFNDEISDVYILGRQLKLLQETFVADVGGTLIDVGDRGSVDSAGGCFIFDDDLFFSSAFVKKAVLAVRGEKRNLRFVLRPNPFNERFLLPHPDHVDYGYRVGMEFRLRDGPAEDYFLSQDVFEYSIAVPDQIVRGGVYAMCVCDTFATHLISPFHLLFANLAQNLARTVPLHRRIPSFLKNRLGAPGTYWFYKGLRSLNRLGRKCGIHPSAIIEGSVIGNNVQIGANAVIRLSVVGDGCTISDNVCVVNSILGDRTHISNSNYLNSCQTYPEVFLIHGPYQFSIFGMNASCFAVINCDIRLDQKTISIPTSFGLLNSRQPILGVAYGHRSRTGGGNIIAAGRIVPNDHVIKPPGNIILGFDSL